MELLNVREVFKRTLRDLFFDNTCSSCFKVLDRDAFLCEKCLKRMKAAAYLKNFSDYYYLFYYDEKIRDVITDFKIRNRKALAYDLAFIIREALENLLKSEKIDFVITVPISKERLKERGFNQVEYLLEILKIKYLKIVRKKNTKHMYSLKNYEKRAKNVEDAFEISIDLSNKKILIIDDIVTSGATIKSIIEEIKKKSNNVDIKIFSIAISRKFTVK